MLAAFPRPDYYGPSAPHPGHQQTTRLPAHPLPGWPGRDGDPERFPRSPSIDRRVRPPALPQRHRHGYAAVLRHGLPAGLGNPAQELPSRHEGRARTAAQPISTGFELVRLLRGFRTLVSLVDLPVLLAGPAPSGSAGTSRRCQGCSHPPRRLPVQAALSFATLPRQRSGAGLSPPLE
jgi:hypothetical protein